MFASASQRGVYYLKFYGRVYFFSVVSLHATKIFKQKVDSCGGTGIIIEDLGAFEEIRVAFVEVDKKHILLLNWSFFLFFLPISAPWKSHDASSGEHGGRDKTSQ